MSVFPSNQRMCGQIGREDVNDAPACISSALKTGGALSPTHSPISQEDDQRGLVYQICYNGWDQEPDKSSVLRK